MPARLAYAATDSIRGIAGSGGLVLVLNSGSSSVKFALHRLAKAIARDTARLVAARPARSAQR